MIHNLVVITSAISDGPEICEAFLGHGRKKNTSCGTHSLNNIKKQNHTHKQTLLRIALNRTRNSRTTQMRNEKETLL